MDNCTATKTRQYTDEQITRRDQFHKSAFPNLHDAADYSKIEEHVQRSKILLIRHANSISNNLSEKLTQEKGVGNVKFGDWLDIQFAEDVIDCRLSEKGIK